MKKLFLFSVILLTLVGLTNAAVVIDQQQTDNAGLTYQLSIVNNQYVEQDFTPTLDNIQQVELWLSTTGTPGYTGTAKLQIERNSVTVCSQTFTVTQDAPHAETISFTNCNLVLTGGSFKLNVSEQTSDADTNLFIHTAATDVMPTAITIAHNYPLAGSNLVNDAYFKTSGENYLSTPIYPVNQTPIVPIGYFHNLNFQWTKISGVANYAISVRYLGNQGNINYPNYAPFEALNVAYYIVSQDPSGQPVLSIPGTQLHKQPMGYWQWRIDSCIGPSETNCVWKQGIWYNFQLNIIPPLDPTNPATINSGTTLKWELNIRHNVGIANGVTHIVIKLEGLTPGTFCSLVSGVLPPYCYIPIPAVTDKNFFQFNQAAYNALTGPANSQFRWSIVMYKSPSGSTLPTWWTATDSANKAKKASEVLKFRFGVPQTFTKP